MLHAWYCWNDNHRRRDRYRASSVGRAVIFNMGVSNF